MRTLRLPALHRLLRLAALGTLSIGPALAVGCGNGSPHHPVAAGGPPAARVTGQTSFQSAPMLGQVSATASGHGGPAGGAADAGALAPTSGASGGASAAPRTVQETDIYRVEGNRLYYLNSYRGLMVFDVSNPDHPTLLGRSPIFGDPQEMIVQNGIAVAVVGDWYGQNADGSPFYGSIIRGLDATDPTNIKPVGEVQLAGWVKDTRVVGSVLYAVAEDYGWEYGWYNAGTAQQTGPSVAIASVSFAGGVVTKTGYQTFPNSSGGVFNVTPNAIMLATSSGTSTSLQYVDISDPAGAIKLRGSISVDGAITGWGPDNGRWNLDFADGVTAHTLGCGSQWCGDPTDSYILSTVDFSNPDAPAKSSQLPIASLGWSVAARFSGNLLYLSPNGYFNYGTLGDAGASNQTPFSIYDLSAPAAPKLAGTTQINGSVWMYVPDGSHLFSIGNTSATPYGGSSQVAVQYLDVSNPAAPSVLGTAAFGSGWAWTPAAETFKAFTVDDSKGLAIVPFSGWDYTGATYTNGVELIQYTPKGITGSSTASTKGWVERGIFVNNRLYSLSDQSLASIDYSDPSNPKVVSELTLARNVVSARPQGTTIAELSSDWWGNDTTTSEMRVLPIANAAESSDSAQAVSASIAGVGAQVFQNGDLAYVVTQVQHQAPCGQWGPSGVVASPSGTTCPTWTQQVQIVDTSNGGAKLRGVVTLPDNPVGWYGGGWEGFWYFDWFDGADVVQVNGSALAFRRWSPQYAYDQASGSYTYLDALDSLYVVDLSNADAPTLASTTVTDDPQAWWGNLKSVGANLYATHYEWLNRPDPSAPAGTDYYVAYYLDQIDLSDLKHPKVGAKINVPGVLVGGSTSDPTVLYTIDYRWNSSNNPTNELDVVKLDGGLAYLQSVTPIDGWVGNVIVQNDKAYMSAQEYDWMNVSTTTYTPPYVELHQVDFSNPQKPVDRISSDKNNGWGWLLGLAGDRAVVTSGWGQVGVDIYKLSDTSAPLFDQSVRTQGWSGANSISRQGSTLFLSTGYWGVQPITLQ